MMLNRLPTLFIAKNNIKIAVLLSLCSLVYVLAIFQDYLYSQLKSTGFYWSDTMLYNTYWLLFILGIPFAKYVYFKIQPRKIKSKIAFGLASGVVFTTLHILFFTFIFVIFSTIIYSTPHRFSVIIKNAISNQSQITLLLYIVLPIVVEYLINREQKSLSNSSKKFITVKKGLRSFKIDTSKILYIKSDKPYSAFILTNQKILHNESLKLLETQLNSQIFLRVHRSTIINTDHLSEIRSRKNGDYDGILSDGQIVRLSRHYRSNWINLVHH